MTKCICFFECYGKPSEDITYSTFYKHIKENSLLLNDKDNSHCKLIKELNLRERSYYSKL